MHGLASGPTASGPEALPTHRPRQTVEALVWLWRATSLTYACVRQRFDKMANMPSLSNTHTHTPICNTIQHHIWAGNNASNSHMCTRSPKTGQGLVLYSILFGKTMPPSTISNNCVWLRSFVDQSTTLRLQNGHLAYCFGLKGTMASAAVGNMR